MFLKNLFSKTNPTAKEAAKTPPSLPSGHPSVPSNAAQAGCPFMANKGKSEEEPAARGGCPFMNTGDNQKNPPLQLPNQCFDQPFVSKFRFFLSDSKMDLDYMQANKVRRIRPREVFNRHPIYLQHSLFFHSEDMNKIRTLECCSRFMAYEELREKGNKEFHKGEFFQSLEYYERAYSLFKWLQHEDQPALVSQASCGNLLEDEISIDQGANSKIELNLDSETQKEIPAKKGADDEFRKKHKEFFVLYCDENTRLCDGQEMSEGYDMDMRKSLLVQILLNLSASYIMLNHYSLAYVCCEEAEQLTDKVSQIQFRKAQCVALNQSASVSQLQRAKETMELAISKKPHQKVFKEVNSNILKMLNLHDSDEAYNKCLQLVTKRIDEVSKKAQEKEAKLFQRAAQIHSAEIDIISRGMVPQERVLEHPLFQSVEFRVVERIKSKYLKVIDFFMESQKPDQVKAAKRELQEVLRVSLEMCGIAQISLNKCPSDLDLGDRQSSKVINRIQKIKLQQAEEHYNHGRYNFQMLEWAIKEIVQEDHKRQEEEKKKEAAAFGVEVKTQSKAAYLWLLILLPILLMAATRFLL